MATYFETSINGLLNDVL